MQITETNVDGLKREFKVVVAAQEIDAKIQAKLQELTRTVKLPGFRPGKVPLAVVSRRYGASVAHEVVETEVTEAAHQAVSDRGLRVAMQPTFNVTPYREGQDLEFSVAVEVLPDVEPVDFGLIEVERLVAEVDDVAVEAMVASLAEYSRSSEPVAEDRGAAPGDLVVIDFTGTVDGEAKAGMDATDHELTLGQGSFLPDFEQALEGARPGEHRQIRMTFPADYGSAELAGRDAVFEVDVKDLRRSIPAAIDDALAKRFGLEDLTALRASARARLTKECEGLSRTRLKRALLDRLAVLHDFPVPPSMVEVEFDAAWRLWEREKEAGRLPKVELERDLEANKAEYRQIAERRVRLGLLLSEIARRNAIKVTQDELNRALIAEARRYPGHEREVLDLFRKNEQAVERLRGPLYEDKTVDFILELVRVTDRSTSIEELRREPDEDR